MNSNPRASAGAEFRRRLGVPGCQVVYWEPDPAHPVAKVCSKCGEDKHLMEFYLRYEQGRRRRDCKACTRSRSARDYQANRAHRCAYARRWYRANRERCWQNLARWRRRNPDRVREYRRRSQQRSSPHKLRVRQATQMLRRLGFIAWPQRCADCGRPATLHHHLNYTDPFAVIPLCRPCHLPRHGATDRSAGGGPVKHPEDYRTGKEGTTRLQETGKKGRRRRARAAKPS